MGRAHEVRAASMAKTAAMKSSKYGKWGKEIFAAAKAGDPDPEMNQNLKNVIARAKKDQVPADVIKRAIDKVNSGADETYETVKYELFGPAGSTLIVECLTDNVNRSVSSVRAVINKCKSKMGSMGSVSYNYDNLCIIGFKGLSADETLEVLMENDVDAEDIEEDNDLVIVYGDPQDSYKIKEAIQTKLNDVNFEIDEISMLPKDKVTLAGEDLEIFNRLLTMLDDVEDVNKVYHNVELG